MSVRADELTREPLALDEARRTALRDVWTVWWSSRALIWVAGLVVFWYFGDAPFTDRLDWIGRTEPFDSMTLNDLVAPGTRWDSVWYLAIADDGYDKAARGAFYPLYPLLVGAAGHLGNQVLAGLAISWACGMVGLYLMHRLAALDLGLERARLTILFCGFFPGCLCLSAVYTESLFLALSVGAIYAARLDRWALAGVLGGLAAATRSVGVFVLVPLLVILVYGPLTLSDIRAGARPRRVRITDATWLLLVPCGVLAYVWIVWVTLGDPLAGFQAQAEWERSFRGPLSAVVDGAAAPFDMSRERAGLVAFRDVALFGFLAWAVWMTVIAFRRLPLAYGAYVVAALALPLSTPSATQPLMSLPRFVGVLFPIFMAAAIWAEPSDTRRRVLLVVSGVGLAAWSGLFTTWSWAP